MFENKNIKTIIYYASLILAIIGIIYFINRAVNDFIFIKTGLCELFNNSSIIVIELLLMIINILLESYRWRLLDRKRSNSCFFYNIKTILESIALSSFTPGGVGEHIAKINRSNNIKGSLVASLTGSVIQTITILLMGIIGLVINDNISLLLNKYIIIFVVCSCIIFYFIILYSNKFTDYIRNIWGEYDLISITRIFFINIIRYLVFSYQLYLLFTLSICEFDFNLIGNIYTYYLIITFIPSIGLGDIGIRGSVALYVFGSLYGNQWSGIAIIMIWLINRVIPALIGTYFIIRND